MMRSDLSGVKRVVVKIGTTSITDKDGAVDNDFMDVVATQVHDLKMRGIEVILVSSGAIGIGLHVMDVEAKPQEVPIRQAAASVGQGLLMLEWCKSFARNGGKVAQILLTYDFYSDRERYLNLRNNIHTLLDHDVVPIINENDALCINEIGAVFGDNDTLSAMIASKVEADLLIILSDVDGLYDRNPKTHDDAVLISEVREVTPEIESFGGDPISTKGVGGMRTKIQAASICMMSGCHMIIANHSIEDVILRIMGSEQLGTMFHAGEALMGNRVRWILLAASAGTVEVDTGARAALRTRNGLLPSGVLAVRGMFSRGDVVDLECDGDVFAKGITDISSEELQRLRGAQTDEIEGILGYRDFTNVIKRQNLAFY